MRRIRPRIAAPVAVAATVTLALVSTSPASASAASHTAVAASRPAAVVGGAVFSDVPAGTLFYNEINWMAYQGISTGWAEGDGTRTYRPLVSVSRDAMAAFMYRFAGSPAFTPPAVSPFADLTPSTQFYKEITWLASEEISTGWTEPDGRKSYRPLQPVNRDAMAAFMYRFADSPTFTPPAASPFSDVPPGAQFYKEITWLASTGVTTGWQQPDGSRLYQPLSPVNRDAMAAFMHRLYRHLHPLEITSSTVPAANLQEAYRAGLNAAVETATYPLEWTVTGGSLPPGLALGSDFGGARGIISGTPTAAGEFTAAITVKDAAGTTSTKQVVVNVHQTPLAPLTSTAQVLTSQIDAGDSSTSFALKEDGSLWTWGGNDRGMLGNASGALMASTAVKIPGLDAVRRVETSYGAVLALTTDGSLWTWGTGQGGSPELSSIQQPPALVPGLGAVADIAVAGGSSIYALMADGTVRAWGSNYAGQLGDGTTTATTAPVHVQGLTNVKALAAGPQGHSVLALKNDGTVWAWGSNLSGQLGDGSTTDSSTPKQVPGLSSVTEVITNGLSAFALRSDGTLRAWGYNNVRQLGVGDQSQVLSPLQVNITGVQSVAVGGSTTYAVKQDGTAWSWGLNTSGELGIGYTGGISSAPTQISLPAGITRIVASAYGTTSSSAFALTSQGSLYAWGRNETGQLGLGGTGGIDTPTTVTTGGTVADISVGESAIIIALTDGRALSWGLNASGQLGHGTTAPARTPTAVRTALSQ